jgi:DNA-binding transcriptional ArsR family regulator
MYFLYADVAAGGDLQVVLHALGDPTRRRILDRLTAGPETVGALAREEGISQPAVSQHLRVLREAGLVDDQRVGRQRWYRAEPAGLATLQSYLEGTIARIRSNRPPGSTQPGEA